MSAVSKETSRSSDSTTNQKWSLLKLTVSITLSVTIAVSFSFCAITNYQISQYEKAVGVDSTIARAQSGSREGRLVVKVLPTAYIPVTDDQIVSLRAGSGGEVDTHSIVVSDSTGDPPPPVIRIPIFPFGKNKSLEIDTDGGE